MIHRSSRSTGNDLVRSRGTAVVVLNHIPTLSGRTKPNTVNLLRLASRVHIGGCWRLVIAASLKQNSYDAVNKIAEAFPPSWITAPRWPQLPYGRRHARNASLNTRTASGKCPTLKLCAERNTSGLLGNGLRFALRADYRDRDHATSPKIGCAKRGEFRSESRSHPP
jgi:hypothetical protein